ncbi:unnamed protein product [Notodromas monacha]|uniref:Uncharacterized protein n=1 Tax=Notodromas monacha TaxID=399045 RepID=A0A7R9GBT7_9CRUS|nr:unnamed protein product [Notodromas monacha]CAG0916728.1 unnamed protein product [Notodromas monacha]
MEVVIFKDYCQTVTGPIPAELTIGVRRFDTFQLFQADSTWGPLEHIAFSSYFTDATGLSYIEVVRVYEDDKVQVHYEIVDSPNGDWQTGELLCPLSTSAVFHASSRESHKLHLQLNSPTLHGYLKPNCHGGVLWQSYISNAPDDQGFFYGVSSSIVSNPTVDGGLAWDVISFTLTPDDRVLVNFHLYDIPAGGDLLPDPSGALIECELHHGGGGGPGSVYFYRYP